jgi:hypothetical protein
MQKKKKGSQGCMSTYDHAWRWRYLARSNQKGAGETRSLLTKTLPLFLPSTHLRKAKFPLPSFEVDSLVREQVNSVLISSRQRREAYYLVFLELSSSLSNSTDGC